MPKDGKTAAIIALILATLYFWKKKPPPIPPPLCTPGETKCEDYNLYRCSLEREWYLEEENSPTCGYTPPVPGLASLSGSVTDDDTGDIIDMALVEVEGFAPVRTNELGNYHIIEIPPGTYAIRFRHIDYQERIISKTLVTGANRLDATLEAIAPAQIGLNCRNITTTSAELGAGASIGCYFAFWLKNGEARKVAESGFVPAHTDYWASVSGLTPGTKYTFTAIGTYNSKTISGSMSFTTRAEPPPPAPSNFKYSNMNLQIPYISVPGAEEGFYYIDLRCDITNIGGEGALEVSVWWYNHNMVEWSKISSPSFAGWASWAIPPGGLGWNPGTMQLTLAPGETYHFHYAGANAAWNDYNWVQMRDSAGGISETIKKFSGSRTD